MSLQPHRPAVGSEIEVTHLSPTLKPIGHELTPEHRWQDGQDGEDGVTGVRVAGAGSISISGGARRVATVLSSLPAS